MSISEQKDEVKTQLHTLLKDKKLAEIKALFLKHNVSPHEEISAKGHLWTAMHYACHFDYVPAMEFFLNEIYSKKPNDYSKILNIQSKEGWTPLMISSIYKSINTLNLLLKYGGLYLLKKDNDGKTASDLATKYGATECANAVKKKLAENDNQDFLPINTSAFSG